MKKHVLIAEDDRVILFALSEGLARAGYRTTTASNGEHAWQEIQKEMPDLILLDIRMPIMDGLEVAKNVRTISEVPIVFLTAHSDADQVDKSVSVGGFGYLVKPLEIHQIIPMIELALARGSELRALRSSEAGLQSALNGSREISVAIGMLKERHNLTEEEAFNALRVHARRQRRTIRDVAREVADGSIVTIP
jgi:response regulator NasT